MPQLTRPTRPRPVRRRRPGTAVRRVGAAAVVATLLAAVTVASAQAHVRVHADSTISGSFSQLSFRVPNESDTAGTTKVEVTLPQDTPFLSVSTKPLPGWTATVTEQPLPAPVTVGGTTLTKAPRTVTWQAQAGLRLEPGQYQDFDISVGPLPAAGTIRLPATQTYSDGTVVDWDQAAPAGGPEPEHPAPALVVTAATAPPASGPGAASGPTGVSTSSADATSSATSTSSTDPVARVLGVVALLVALLAAAAVAARWRQAGRAA
jgi:periplasmic copper chaperone A